MTPTEATTTLAIVAEIIDASAKHDGQRAGTTYRTLRDHLINVARQDQIRDSNLN
jgi:hypothetical protein